MPPPLFSPTTFNELLLMDVNDSAAGRICSEEGLGRGQDTERSVPQRECGIEQDTDQLPVFEEIVGSSPALQSVVSRIVRVGPTDSTVLITGETGTGKELVARAIHKRSQRST